MSNKHYSVSNSLASHLRSLHSEEAEKLEMRLEAEKAEEAKKQLETKKLASKTFALEKAEYRHKKLERDKKDTVDLSGGCVGYCDAKEDNQGWWHWGCSKHCFCYICKKASRNIWRGLD